MYRNVQVQGAVLRSSEGVAQGIIWWGLVRIKMVDQFFDPGNRIIGVDHEHVAARRPATGDDAQPWSEERETIRAAFREGDAVEGEREAWEVVGVRRHARILSRLARLGAASATNAQPVQRAKMIANDSIPAASGVFHIYRKLQVQLPSKPPASRTCRVLHRMGFDKGTTGPKMLGLVGVQRAFHKLRNAKVQFLADIQDI